MERTRTLLITGASTGIGEACALHMAKRGWRVFAGVRRAEDGESLAAKGKGAITPVLLDVTNANQIGVAAKQIEEELRGKGLDALLNNAGIAIGGPLEFQPLADVERQFRVNVLGAVAVTQAFLPQIRQARGRVVFTSSNSGFWCEPFVAAYGGTKHALEGMCDSLRVELRPWGIHVVLIEPGMIKTPIWDKARAASEQAEQVFTDEALTLYGDQMEVMRRVIDKAARLAASPRRVARALQRALESSRPRTRYQVGIDSWLQYRLRCFTPDRFRDWIAQRLLNM